MSRDTWTLEWEALEPVSWCEIHKRSTLDFAASSCTDHAELCQMTDALVMVPKSPWTQNLIHSVFESKLAL